MSVGTWFHIAGTYDKEAGGTDEIKVYINGTLYGTHDYSAFIAVNNVPVTIGKRAYAGAEGFFDGSLFLPRIHNRALSAAEVRGLYKDGGGTNTFGALSIIQPRQLDESLVFQMDAPTLAANRNTGKVLPESAVIADKSSQRNYGTAIGGVTVGNHAIAP